MARLNALLRSEWTPLLVLLLALSAARSSLADHYYVPSGSMEFTLMPGDRVVVNKAAYGLRIPFTKIDIMDSSAPVRGDIAIFDSPDDGARLIKRIVAIGGDSVRLVDGRLTINGERISDVAAVNQEKFATRRARLNLASGGGPDVLDVVIPPNMFLAIGDNRGRSRDGRYFGLIHERELYGRAVAVYYRKGDGFGWHAL
ncbi:MAG: signal peptidase I [Pseudomonadota bacterium]